MKDKPLKVLFTGLGSIGQRHLRNLKLLLPDTEFLAYRVRGQKFVLNDTLQIDSSKNLEKEFNLIVYRDIEASLEEKPDVVFITNPTHFHVEIALKAAQAGCHLFIEKPLSDRWDHVEELIKTIKKNKRVAYIGYQFRFHPVFRKVKEWVQQGAVGSIVSALIQVGEYMPGFHTYEDYRQTYPARRDLGGGTILTQIHEIDLIYALFGLPQKVFTIGGHLSSLEIDVEDVGSTLMEFRRSDGKFFPVHLHQDYLQNPPQRKGQIIGDKGKIVWDLLESKASLFNYEGKKAEVSDHSNFKRNQMFIEQMKHFIDCLQGTSRPVVSVKEGAQSLKIALAEKKSMDIGAPVEVERNGVI